MNLKSPVREEKTPLSLTRTNCCLCQLTDGEPLAIGEDFEYRTSPDSFLAMKCNSCGLVYLNPRPSLSEFQRIYPANYHAFEFSQKEFGFVYKVRRRLEAKRVLGWCKGLSDKAKIIDIGCGDGFHLSLLKDYGKANWQLEGVDADERAASVAKKNGLDVHCGLLENLNLQPASYDLAFLIQTIEHLADPPKLLRDVRSLLRPGGKVIIVTDNTDSFDFKIYKDRHWGGYHFPRHWYLFNKETMRLLAKKVDLEVESLTTAVSPVNWVYSIRNSLTDMNAPSWLLERFSLKSTMSLSFFTALDMFNQFIGRGALLNAILKRPE